ncbi:hypothetical protein BZG05_14020 [Salinivibrio kushneri]|nr:hypothetical protein BZG05_14020 [Salinivibrio kushneri]
MIAEVEYGDIVQHPWGMELDKLRLFAVAVTGMLNVFPFILKSSSLNRDQRIIIDGLSYLVQCLLIRCGSQLAANLLFEPEQYSELERKIPDKLKIMRYEPIFNAIYHDLGVYCSSKYCSKLHHMSPDEKPDYFLRFVESTNQPKIDDRFLIMNSIRDECQLGLVEVNKYCPLGETDDLPKNLETLQEKMEFARMVIDRRAGEAIENA